MHSSVRDETENRDLTRLLIVLDCCTTEDSTILTLWDPALKSRTVLATSEPIDPLIPVGAEIQLKIRSAGHKVRNPMLIGPNDAGDPIEIMKYGSDQFPVRHLVN